MECPDSFLYVFSSAGNCAADVANRHELAKWKIVPRMLRDVTNRNLKVCSRPALVITSGS